jgi:nitroreductase
MSPARPGAGVRDFLALRRSAGKLFLGAPGPSADELDELLTVAARVPDHRKLSPWRFIVFEDAARAAFGQTLAAIYDRNHPGAEAKDLLDAAGLFLRAPVVVAVVSAPVKDGRTPAWEQELSAGAVCYNLLLAANACGWAGTWLTEWLAYDAAVAEALMLGPDEKVAGFVYLGTAAQWPPERPRAAPGDKISRWRA